MITHSPTATIRCVGISFDEHIINILDAICEDAGRDEDGMLLSRSEIVRRFVLIGLDLLERDHPVLQQYVNPEKVRAAQ